MKNSLRLACLVLALILAAGSLAAQDVTLPLNAIQAKHFTAAESFGRSPEFPNFFYEGLLKGLAKVKVAKQVLGEDAAVPEADAANAVIVEGQFLEYKDKGLAGLVKTSISLYRASDRKLLTTIAADIPFKRSPLNKDKNVGEWTGLNSAFQVQKALKKLKAS